MLVHLKWKPIAYILIVQTAKKNINLNFGIRPTIEQAYHHKVLNKNIKIHPKIDFRFAIKIDFN